MNARRDLYAALMAGGPHSPQRSEKASELIDAFRAELLVEAKTEVVAWLAKKANEDTPVWQLASKVDRGAIRLFLDAERGESR